MGRYKINSIEFERLHRNPAQPFFVIILAFCNRRRNRNVEPIVNIDLLYPLAA